MSLNHLFFTDKPVVCTAMQFIVPACGEVFRLPTPYDTTPLRLWLTSPLGRIYYQDLTTDANGWLSVDPSTYPDALFTPYSGTFIAQINYPNAPYGSFLYFESATALHPLAHLRFAQMTAIS